MAQVLCLSENRSSIKAGLLELRVPYYLQRGEGVDRGCWVPACQATGGKALAFGSHLLAPGLRGSVSSCVWALLPARLPLLPPGAETPERNAPSDLSKGHCDVLPSSHGRWRRGPNLRLWPLQAMLCPVAREQRFPVVLYPVHG